jgi:oxygen-independent coproporphyrinogen-3 oxidase
MEGNPESLSAEILTAARAAGINRLSIGIQSLNDAELRTLGRLHNARDVETAVLRARNAGFSNCGVDLMYGIPAQTTASWEATLRRAIALETEHLSLYALTVEPDTPFGRDHVRTDDDVQASMYEQAIDILASEGFEHYEISNWARPGFRCRHNMVYWSNREYMGVGVAAASYFNGCRYTNTGTIEKYIDGIGRNESVVEESETIDDNLRLSEELILKLRCADGVKITDTIHNAYGAVIERLIEQGLLCRADQRLTLSRKGLFLATQVLQEFV